MSIEPEGATIRKALKAKAKYTIYAALEETAGLWLGLATCFEPAIVGKYGPELPNVGNAVFAGHDLFTSTGVIEIIPGEATGAGKC